MAKKATSVVETSVEKKVPNIPINVLVIVHKDWMGETVISSKRSSVTDHKFYSFDCQLGVPSTDEEAKTLYNKTMKDIIKAGCRQLAYGETITKNLIEEREKAGLSLDDPEFLELVGKEVRSALLTEKREGAGATIKAQANQLQAVYMEYGLDPKIHGLADLKKAILEKAGM